MIVDEQKNQCITYLLKGEKITDIAKLIDCSRTAIYDWLRNPDFMAEVHKREQEMKTAGNKKILSDVETYIDKLKLLATKSNSQKVQLAATEYLLDRIYGRPTTKQEILEDRNKDKDDIDDDVINKVLNEDIEKEDKEE